MSRRKVIQYTSTSADVLDIPGGHGTHTSGTAVGHNSDIFSDSGQNSGVAPDAKIAFMDIASGEGGMAVPSTNDLLFPGYNIGARVFSFSWGSRFASSDQYYIGHDIDEFLFNHQDAVIFFAAGNFGETADPMTCSMEATGKNVVAVGASESESPGDSTNKGNVAYFSSHGPTYDGRIKPDIVAPGLSTMSAAAGVDATAQSCEVVSKQGTSMACPGAAGAALLVQQYFRSQSFWATMCRTEYKDCHDAFSPSGVLIKAVMLHSGQAQSRYEDDSTLSKDLKSPPDSYQGYGRITLATVLPLPGVNTFDLFVADQVTISSSSTMFVEIIVQDSSTPFKVTLSWYDPPQMGRPARALLHNLDLIVEGPSGQR